MQSNTAKIIHPEFVIKHTNLELIKNDEYQELLDSMKVILPNHLHAQILKFCVDVGITMYDYDKIDDYFTKIAKKIDKKWIWRPIKNYKDCKNIEGHGLNIEYKYTKFLERKIKGSKRITKVPETHGHGSYNGYSIYRHVIPISHLKNVKLIDDKFKNQELRFFVSDYAVPTPDPAIMVTSNDLLPFKIIFGLWDEPSYN